jgi:hypothetical protein
MKALLTVVMALALTPFFANAEEAKATDAAAPATEEAAPAEAPAADAKKEEAKK